MALDGISGSYAPEDVHFLLTQVSIPATAVAEKEHMIQSGRAHYSEMISEELRPDLLYLEIFHEVLGSSKLRIAREILSMAGCIAKMVDDGLVPSEITLCSLVRAGVPVGVLLRRALARMGIDAAHFGVSIIRDKGLDMVAMRHICSQRDPAGIIFVDGWTGKGAISVQLRKTWHEETGCEPILAVLADPCGHAHISGSHEDWLIPTGLLGANVSGLISRSILNAEIAEHGLFHGFMPVDHLRDIDVSRHFVDEVSAEYSFCEGEDIPPVPLRHMNDTLMMDLRNTSETVVGKIMESFDVSVRNRVKPGLAEATRAVLRREPHMVFLRSSEDPDLSAILHLCRSREVPFTISPEMTGIYRAVTLISKA